MCLAGTVLTSWSLMQEVTDSSHFAVMTNIFTIRSRKTPMTTTVVGTRESFVGFADANDTKS